MVIVENEKEWSQFLEEFKTKDSFIVPIACDDNKHPIDTDLCLLYISIMPDFEEYILPFKHSDTENLDVSRLKELITEQDLYCLDKKKLLHFVDLPNLKDMQMITYLEKNETIVIEDTITNAHEHFHRIYWGGSNLNCVIPILKHLEACRTITMSVRESVFYNTKPFFDRYNMDVLENLQQIESVGLQTTDGMVYSEYNPYTATGRPSNRFGGLNFAALNKKDGSREKFISRFGDKGMLVEMDYDAYHLRLIGDIVGYSFSKGSVHEHMAKLYGVDYEEAKSLSFQYLYGHIPEEVLNSNPFFMRVQKYIDKNWARWEKDKFIISDIYSKKIYSKNLPDMNANKLFNYSIQLMETENNMRMLRELLPKIKEYESKLVLYNYDSFLFDFHIDDGIDFLRLAKRTIESDSKFPVKVSKGWNYHQMEDITEKFV